MEGDKLIFKPEHQEKADWACNLFAKHLMTNEKPVFSIFGEAGTGKSEIAYLIATRYAKSIPCIVVHLDDYYKTLPKNRNRARRESGVIGIEEINWGLLDRTIRGYRYERLTAVRRINAFSGGVEWIYSNSKDAELMILEGLYAGLRGTVSARVAGTYKDTKNFRIKRGKERQCAFRDEVLKIEADEVSKISSHYII